MRLVGQQWENDITQRLFERPPDVLRGFFFKSSKVWEVRLPVVVIQLKLAMAKQRKWDWSGNNVQMTLHSNFKLSSSKKIWNMLEVFFF